MKRRIKSEAYDRLLAEDVLFTSMSFLGNVTG
jgi:hypothetical protein